jgi:hypothetical protein
VPAFQTPLTVVGPWRSPRQLLADQTYDGHASVHDEVTAAALGLRGAPIEGPTHFSQFDPLAFALWGQRWFETGCLSAHFQNMVVEGDEVQAELTSTAPGQARIGAMTREGTSVLTGTASIGTGGATELDQRLARTAPATDLTILDRLEIGMRSDVVDVAMEAAQPNGPLYPFSLDDKLAVITEPSPWYTDARPEDSPWGRPILPLEMIAVLALRTEHDFPVRTPSVGLFLDLEIRLELGPVFVGERYDLRRTIVALGRSRRTESYWLRSQIVERNRGLPVATVVLHHGVFLDSYSPAH